MHNHERQSTPITQSERTAWLRLFRTKNVGVITFQKLLARYGTATEALAALPDLAKRGGASKPLKPPAPNVIDKERKALHKLGGRIITLLDPEYPEPLKAIPDAPPVLSIIGNPDLLKQTSIAMVGARNASLNGKKFAQHLAQNLGQKDQIITSGLARGIDTAAHQGALQTGTIAVVAGGIDVIYPEENTDLYKDIAQNGLIIAESPLGSKPFRESFPRRNRIVSGLSKATIVVEATMRSGSLITARLAGEQGRDVFAVPGHPMDPRASGPNKLIRDGATLIRNADDVLENLLQTLPLGFAEPANTDTFHHFADDTEIPENAQQKILDHLSYTPTSIDELLRTCDVSIPAMQTILLELDLAGRIKRLPGNRVSLID